MSDRLAELRRQRALVQQHLEWLDREITTAAGSAPARAADAPADPAPPASSQRAAPSTSTAGAPAPDPDAILAQYHSEPTSLRHDVRQGCLLYFAAAIVLLGLGVMALYYLLRLR